MSFLRSLALQNSGSGIHPAQSSGGSKESFLRSVSANGGIDDNAVGIGTGKCQRDHQWFTALDRQALPFQLHLVMLLCSPPPRTRLERLAQQRFGFGLHLSEQDEAVFVEFLAARLGLDGGDAVLDFAEVVDDLPDAQGSRLVDYVYALVRQ
jgi:hypothetical protein